MSQTSTPLKPILWIVGVFAVWDLLMWRWLTSLGRGEVSDIVTITFMVGASVAQFSLFAIGSILIPGTFWKRLAFSSGVALLWFTCWQVGYCSSNLHDAQFFSDYTKRFILFSFCLLPVVILSLQAPLWFARNSGAWRIVAALETNGRRSLTTRDLLAGTGFIAFTISCVRFANYFSRSGDLGRAMTNVAWLQALVCGLLLSAASLAIIFPFVISLLSTHNIERKSRKLAFYLGFLWILCPVFLMLTGERPDSVVLFGWGGIILLSALQLVAPLLYLRSYGYRLLRGAEEYPDAAHQQSPQSLSQ